jgi:hypothetical protein
MGIGYSSPLALRYVRFLRFGIGSARMIFGTPFLLNFLTQTSEPASIYAGHSPGLPKTVGMKSYENLFIASFLEKTLRFDNCHNDYYI